MFAKSLSMAALVSLACASARADPPPASLVGHWLASTPAGPYTLAVEPDGTYVETIPVNQPEQMNRSEMREAGKLRASAPSTVSFDVEDWRPRAMAVFMAQPNGPALRFDVPVAKPDGGVWRLQFNGADSFTMTDVKAGGSLTFKRGG